MLDKQKNSGTPIKYLRNINVRWFSFDLSDVYEMKIEEEDIEKHSIQKDDLVICEGGEPGRCAVWERDEKIVYQKALHRVKFNRVVNPKYYMYFLWFAAQTGKLNSYFTGSGIKHLTKQSLSRFPVPECSKELQDIVVEDIESRLLVCENIEQSLIFSYKQANAIRQSILKTAFEGI
jgi:type I restriction enzyme S subunit